VWTWGRSNGSCSSPAATRSIRSKPGRASRRRGLPRRALLSKETRSTSPPAEKDPSPGPSPKPRGGEGQWMHRRVAPVPSLRAPLSPSPPRGGGRGRGCRNEFLPQRTRKAFPRRWRAGTPSGVGIGKAPGGVKPRVESSEPGDEGPKRVIAPGSPLLVLLRGADTIAARPRPDQRQRPCSPLRGGPPLAGAPW
jgi:hypothetical protein